MSSSPAFGQADLSNCEREQIHLAGSIQPHGLLLAISEPQGRIVQASVSASRWLQTPLDGLLLHTTSDLGGTFHTQLRALLRNAEFGEPQALRCSFPCGGDEQVFEGLVHRTDAGTVVVEVEPVDPGAEQGAPRVDSDGTRLMQQLGQAIQRLSEASSIGVLADSAVRAVRDLVGYDRVMVYKFDPDGHGKIIAEARDPRLDSLLGHHYPATDIPQRARELYVRNKVRVLVDVHYEPSPLVPRLLPGESSGELDMSMCYLRSMSPLHLQYLKNMGVTATLVVSLILEGRLWGLIACHHYQPRNLSQAMRTACDLLGEAIGTRIAAIENYAHAQVAIQVRRLEQRLIEATSTEGDWRLALFRNPRTLLQPLDATGVALFHDGEVLSAGEVPSTPELRALRQWVDTRTFDHVFSTSALGTDNPDLASLTPTASGVLAVRLSTHKPDYLMWLRKEQLHSVTWAGDPNKPHIGDNPMDLSPRRSFAAWSEIVRGTALSWTAGERAMAAALGESLIDIIVQVNAVRLLIAEHQLAQVRSTVSDSREPVVVIAAAGQPLHANEAFLALAGRDSAAAQSLDTLLEWLQPRQGVREMLAQVRAERRSWRGDVRLLAANGREVPVALRVEPVPARDGSLLGYILIFNDLTNSQLAHAARQQLEDALSRAARISSAEDQDLVGAIIANASLAAMDIADSGSAPSVAPLLNEVERSTARATRLFSRIRALSSAKR